VLVVKVEVQENVGIAVDALKVLLLELVELVLVELETGDEDEVKTSEDDVDVVGLVEVEVLVELVDVEVVVELVDLALESVT